MSPRGPAIDLTEETPPGGPLDAARKAWVDPLLSEHDQRPDESYRARVLLTVLVAGSVVAALSMVTRLLDEGIGPGFWGGLVGVVALCSGAVALVRGASRRFIGDLFILFGVVSTWVVASLDGGLQSTAVMWFTILPLIAQLIGGLLRAPQTALLITAGFLAMFGLQRAGMLPIVPPPHVAGTTELFAAVGATAYVGVCAWVFERAHRAAVVERERLAQVQRDWIAVVSHELRTPLTALRGSIDLLSSGKAGDLPPDGERLLVMAKANSDRLVRLVDDVLDLRRLETGRLALAPRRVDLAALIDEAVSRHRPLAETRGVGIRIDSGRLHLRIDPDRMIQVFDNLLSNAIKHAPSDTAVSVICRHEGGHVQVMVNDQGPGVPRDFEALLFTPFAQANSGPMPTGKGSGLGLTICRALIELHGGTIHYEPRASRGARFVIRLPEALIDDTDNGAG